MSDRTPKVKKTWAGFCCRTFDKNHNTPLANKIATNEKKLIVAMMRPRSAAGLRHWIMAMSGIS